MKTNFESYYFSCQESEKVLIRLSDIVCLISKNNFVKWNFDFLISSHFYTRMVKCEHDNNYDAENRFAEELNDLSRWALSVEARL